MKDDTAMEAFKAVPPLGAGGLTLLGFSLNEWVMLASLVYTLFLIIDKLPGVLERIRDFYRYVKDVKSN